jgi:DNA-binding XRE family transcriptional regulator
LYFFHGQVAAVVAHGLVKEKAVPGRNINLAIRRKLFFEANPSKHTLEDPMAEIRDSTTGAVEILHRRFYKGKPEKLESLEETRENEEALRSRAGLTQAQLAKIVGTTASVICRLEDANYEGHSVSMLRRIAAALNSRVEIRFLPARKSA